MTTLSYLDNLVARHLPETAVIQPRPVSLFEPWPGTAVGINPFPVPTSEAETAVSSPVPYPPPRPQTPPSSRVHYSPETAVPPLAGPHTTVPPPPAIAAPLPPPTSSPAVRAASQPAAPTPIPVAPAATLPPPSLPIPTPRSASPESARRLQKQQPLDQTPTTIQPAPLRQPAPTLTAPVSVTFTSPHHQAEPQSAKETHTPVIIQEQITLLKSMTEMSAPSTPTLVEIVHEQPIQPLPPVAAAPAATPEPASQPTTSPAAIRPEQIKPFIPANGRPANHQPPVTPPPEPATTIQITIGRIEVRATPPSAKAEQKQRRTPVLSLDDYLRQRNGGRP